MCLTQLYFLSCHTRSVIWSLVVKPRGATLGRIYEDRRGPLYVWVIGLVCSVAFYSFRVLHFWLARPTAHIPYKRQSVLHSSYIGFICCTVQWLRAGRVHRP